jgi:hypothetical protein
MKCKQCLDLLDEYARGQLAEELNGEMASHIAICDSCTIEYDAHQSLLALFESEPVPVIGQDELADFLPGVWSKMEKSKTKGRSWLYRGIPIFVTAAILAVLILRPTTNIKTPIGLDSVALQNLSNVGDTAITESDYLGIVSSVFDAKQAEELDAIESELTTRSGFFVDGSVTDNISNLNSEDLQKLEAKLREISNNVG